MRKSGAPSYKRIVSNGLIVNIDPTINKASENLLNILNSDENQAKQLELELGILKQKPVPLTTNIEDGPKVLFSVCYGKQSTRKHKIWDGDGILEVMGKWAKLKDENGKIVATEPNINAETLRDGDQISIGSKCVEVCSNLTNSKNEIERSKIKKEPMPVFESPMRNFDEPISKRSRYDAYFVPILAEKNESLVKVSSTTKNNQDSLPAFDLKTRNFEEQPVPKQSENDPFIDPVLAENYEPRKKMLPPFVMKKPSYEHQWKFNIDKKPVTDVIVPEILAKTLRPHQKRGVSFIYECVMGFNNLDYFGAILADEMGLGKTLQCITLIYTLMKGGPYGGEKVAKRVLIVTPSSLVKNWDKEITKWLKHEKVFTFIVGPNNKLKKYVQSPHIPILIISYEMLIKQIEEISTIHFDLMICDEGHRLKNKETKIVTIFEKVECKRRIILTGTPIQNDLQEFYSLVTFVNPGIFGDYQDFKKRYEIPIVQSQQPNVLPEFQKLGKDRAKELDQITSQFVLRRTQEVNNQYLPAKQEIVVFCQPSALQIKLTKNLLNWYHEKEIATSPFQLITIMKKICNCPGLLNSNSNNESNDVVERLKSFLPPWHQMGSDDSGKLAVLDALLEELSGKNEKIVIVSYFAKTLDLIQGLCAHMNYKFLRLDGSTQSADRNTIVNMFNSPTSDSFVFLLSAKAGGTGLNLIGASRLVLYDNDWNPASDLQAMSRIWRDGQKMDVFIYRFLTACTIEEKIYQRQISKTSLSGCVVDLKHNLNNLKLSDEELKDLFTIPDDFSKCLTHEMLDCECDGSGSLAVSLSKSNSDELLSLPTYSPLESPEVSKFMLQLPSKRKKPQKHALRMQELMKWEHHKAPVDEKLLKDFCLQAAGEIIRYIFRNKSNVQ